MPPEESQPTEDRMPTQLAAGALLGPYRIEAPIGAGGMGQVFRATDTRLQRSVAIKVSDHRFSARFEREARAIAQLNHPHICTLHDVGPNYLVMELVDGDTVADRLEKGALPVEQVIRYGAQIADALARFGSPPACSRGGAVPGSGSGGPLAVSDRREGGAGVGRPT